MHRKTSFRQKQYKNPAKSRFLRNLITTICFKKEVFAALYRRDQAKGLQKLTSDLVIAPAKLLQGIGEKTVFLGDGSQNYRSLIEECLGSQAIFAPPHLNHPRATTVAFLGMKELKRGNIISISSVAPVYVRASEAELQGGTINHHEGVDK